MNEIKEKIKISVARALIGKPSQSSLFISSNPESREDKLNFIESSSSSGKAHFIRIKGSSNHFIADLVKELRQKIIINNSVEHSFLSSDEVVSALLSFTNTHAKGISSLRVFGSSEPTLGIADNGVIESDLIDLLEVIGGVARTTHEALVLIVDDLHLLSRENLAALISGLHRCTQSNLPIILFGSGDKGLPEKAINLKGYAERLFLFHF